MDIKIITSDDEVAIIETIDDEDIDVDNEGISDMAYVEEDMEGMLLDTDDTEEAEDMDVLDDLDDLDSEVLEDLDIEDDYDNDEEF